MNLFYDNKILIEHPIGLIWIYYPDHLNDFDRIDFVLAFNAIWRCQKQNTFSGWLIDTGSIKRFCNSEFTIIICEFLSANEIKYLTSIWIMKWFLHLSFRVYMLLTFNYSIISFIIYWLILAVCLVYVDVLCR